MIPPHPIHLANRTRQQPPERPRQRRACKKQSKPLLSLLPSIPHPNQIKTPRHHPTFKQPQEEPRRQQPPIAAHKALQTGHQPETEGASRQVPAGREALEEDVGGDFEDGVGDEEDCEGGVELDAREGEVRLEGEGARVGDVDAVEEGEEVEGADQREDV